MDTEKVLLTKSGVEKLEKERDNLINVERPKVIEELQLARSQGDLSENADYDAARDKQAQLEQRIKEIEYMLQNAEIISEEEMDLNIVKPGTTVTILDLSEEDNFITLTSLSLNTTLSLFLRIFVIFTISKLILKSGLSLPYFSIASLNGILLKGTLDTSLLPNFLNTS